MRIVACSMGKIRIVMLGLRRIIIYTLFVIALFFPLLLNGQDFTNSLMAISCCIVAVLLDLGTCWIPGRSGKPVGPDAAILLCGLILVVVLAVQLPWAFRHEQRFNRAVESADRLRARDSQVRN